MNEKEKQTNILLKHELLKQVRSRYVRIIVENCNFSNEELISLKKLIPRKRRRSLTKRRSPKHTVSKTMVYKEKDNHDLF